ncbi:MAG: hypothetical protein AVDCRST_MAG73-3312, partial [uncultured Thermomicrobiales bacterium]
GRRPAAASLPPDPGWGGRVAANERRNERRLGVYLGLVRVQNGDGVHDLLGGAGLRGRGAADRHHLVLARHPRVRLCRPARLPLPAGAGTCPPRAAAPRRVAAGGRSGPGSAAHRRSLAVPFPLGPL